MDAKEREPWVAYLEGDCLGKSTPEGLRIYQVVIRVKPEGLQGIVKGRVGDEYMVSFVGAGTLSSLSARVRDVILKGGGNFKVDSYPPT